MSIIDALVTPFTDYLFMRRALAACIALSFSCAPVGVFLMLRRMSLMGDAMQHAILPGAALAFMMFGLSLWPMAAGGLAAGLLAALAASAVSRATPLKEDASFAALYLISLATGVMLMSLRGSAVDLMHVLFGNILAVDAPSLFMVAAISTLTMLLLAWVYRALVMECFDPVFLRAVGARGAVVHLLLVGLTVLNLVAGFQALGTLMALGLMILPAVSSSFWARDIDKMIPLAVCFALAGSVGGLLVSYHADLPSGPAIVLMCGVIYILSLALGSHHSLRTRFMPRPHLAA